MADVRTTITPAEHLQLLGLFKLHKDGLRDLERIERAAARIVEPGKADTADWNLADTVTQDELWTSGASVTSLLRRLWIDVDEGYDDRLREGFRIAHEAGGHARFSNGVDGCPLCSGEEYAA
jgi:hypothetical protein